MSEGCGAAGEAFAIGQCVLFGGSEVLEVTGRVLIEGIAPAGTSAFAIVELFSFGGCLGPAGEVTSDAIVAPTGGGWQELSALVDPADFPNAQAALVTFVVQPAVGASFEANLDLLTFAETVDLFADGFESGDLSFWSSSAP